ncbi:Mu transposase C-terminal domain-containing protein [Amycolatopsis sp. NPDC024027]|uniref:Mu transposase C-terminal domain-containing protein n=1 Tax=Amycolatopsis sp. NPDC024027 TaxID=3154327 RepID=UPI0033C8C998
MRSRVFLRDDVTPIGRQPSIITEGCVLNSACADVAASQFSTPSGHFAGSPQQAIVINARHRDGHVSYASVQVGGTIRASPVGKHNWQPRPHDSLRDPHLPAHPLSPNEMFAALVTAAGYVPLPLVGEDYLELLPVTWRRIGADGIHLDHRTYDNKNLNPLRHQHSGNNAQDGRWPVHHDPYDLSTVWIRDTATGTWITAQWTHAHLVGRPFADFTWRAARKIVTDRGGDPTHQAAVAAALDALLTRADRGPTGQRRAAARTRSVPSGLPAAELGALRPAPRDEAPAPEDLAPSRLADVISFGVFDPAAEEPR